MGRKPEGDIARGKLVAVRLTEADKARFEAAAKRDGLPLSSWLRWLAERRDKQTGKRK